MYKKILTLLFCVFSVHCSFAQQIDNTQKNQTLPPAILEEVRSGKAYLIDVRTPEEYAGGHLQYAVNIDYKSDQFHEKIKPLDKKKTAYLYCRSGNRSGKAEDSLKVWGFRHPLNIGGYETLVKQGLPVDPKK